MFPTVLDHEVTDEPRGRPRLQRDRCEPADEGRILRDGPDRAAEHGVHLERPGDRSEVGQDRGEDATLRRGRDEQPREFLAPSLPGPPKRRVLGHDAARAARDPCGLESIGDHAGEEREGGVRVGFRLQVLTGIERQGMTSIRRDRLFVSCLAAERHPAPGGHRFRVIEQVDLEQAARHGVDGRRHHVTDEDRIELDLDEIANDGTEVLPRPDDALHIRCAVDHGSNGERRLTFDPHQIRIRHDTDHRAPLIGHREVVDPVDPSWTTTPPRRVGPPTR